jgi:hypothetical protein
VSARPSSDRSRFQEQCTGNQAANQPPSRRSHLPTPQLRHNLLPIVLMAKIDEELKTSMLNLLFFSQKNGSQLYLHILVGRFLKICIYSVHISCPTRVYKNVNVKCMAKRF